MIPNRTICCCLKEMRTAYDTRNFAYILSLIEEVQSMANRMEASLQDRGDMKYSREAVKRLERDIARLREVKEGLE